MREFAFFRAKKKLRPERKGIVFRITTEMANKLLPFVAFHPWNLKTVADSVVLAGLTDCNYFLTKQIACHEIVLELTT